MEPVTLEFTIGPGRASFRVTADLGDARQGQNLSFLRSVCAEAGGGLERALSRLLMPECQVGYVPPGVETEREPEPVVESTAGDAGALPDGGTAEPDAQTLAQPDGDTPGAGAEA